MRDSLLGCFVTLEGGEGSGRSTLIAALAARAKSHHIDVVTTREPGGTPLAEALRRLALNPAKGERWSPMAEALLMNAARSDHLDKKIRPALEAGQWVLCDRFSDSTLAYQSVDHGVSQSTLLTMEALVVESTRPDVTLVLDAPPEKLLARRQMRGGPIDAFENRPIAYHRKVREAFLSIARKWPDRCIVLDALKTPERLLEEAWAAIEARCLAGAGRA